MAAIIAGVCSPIPVVGTVIAACSSIIAGAMALAGAEIVAANTKGQGVVFYWTWAQLGLLSVPGVGVAALASLAVAYPR